MATKHILPPPEEFFDDDLPEMSRDEMIKMMKDLETAPPKKAPMMSNNVDLHLGPAQVDPLSPWAKDPQWWVKENITKFGLEIIILDCVIAVLCCVMVWLIIDVIIWMFSA